MHLRSVKAQLTNRVACSIAEVDHHDVWQRTRITAACVAREHHEVERLLDEAERWLRGFVAGVPSDGIQIRAHPPGLPLLLAGLVWFERRKPLRAALYGIGISVAVYAPASV